VEDIGNKEKGLLIKTKIVAVLLITIGVMMIPILLFGIVFSFGASFPSDPIMFFYYILPFFIITGTLLLKKKETGWISSIFLLVIAIFFLGSMLKTNETLSLNSGDRVFAFVAPIFLFILIIFLLLDRKKFWRVAK